MKKSFEEVLHDIAGLKGLQLKSIHPGGDLLICDVDFKSKRVIVDISANRFIGRPFSEFQRIWDLLSKTGMVHVETALKGSGSRRNQPETVFASLPYIEWGRVDGKKHLFLIGKNTHKVGTLKEIDPVLLNEFLEKQGNISLSEQHPIFVIVARSVLELFNGCGSFDYWEDLKQGLYAVRFGNIVGWVGDRSVFPHIECGTYLITRASKGVRPESLKLFSSGGVNYLQD